MRVELDRGHLAAELRRLPARRRAQVEHALAVLRADGEPDELRAAALRPDQPVGDGEVVDALDAIRPGNVGRLGARRRVSLDKADDRLERLVHRPHQRERVGGAEVAHPDVVDPVGIGLLQRAVGQAVEQRPDALGEPPHDRVRERHGALEACAADELDRLVRRCVRRRVRVPELVRAEAERRAHRRVELAHRPLARASRSRGRACARAGPRRTRAAARTRARARRDRSRRCGRRGRRTRPARTRAAAPRTRRAGPARRSCAPAAQVLVEATSGGRPPAAPRPARANRPPPRGPSRRSAAFRPRPRARRCAAPARERG